MSLKKVFTLEEKLGQEAIEGQNIALVHFDFKPGTFVSTGNKNYKKELTKILDNLNLKYKEVETSSKISYHIAKKNSHLNQFDIPDNKLNPDKPGGKFYGYPKEAVEFYEKEISKGNLPAKVSGEYMENELDIEDCLYLVNYEPATNKEIVKRAIEKELTSSPA